MVNKKQLAVRAILAGIAVCCLATSIAYMWVGGAGLAVILIQFVAIVSFVSATVLAVLLQVIFIRCNRRTAYIISEIIVGCLVALALWGYNF